jgi:hypothetical protein
VAGLEGFGFTLAKKGVLHGHRISLKRRHRRSTGTFVYRALRKIGNQIVRWLQALAPLARAHQRVQGTLPLRPLRPLT